MTPAELLETYLAPGSRNRRLLQYVLVGALGLGVNQGVLFLATGVAGLSYVIGGTLSRVLSVLTNYALNDAWTWRGRGAAGLREYVVRGLKYVLTRIVGIAIGLAALVVFVELLGLHYLVANVLAVGVGIAWGFGASERWVWRAEATAPTRSERFLCRVRSRLVGRLARLGGTRTERETTRFDGGQFQRPLPTVDWYSLRQRLADVDRATVAVFVLAGALFVSFSVYTSLLYRGYQLTGADFGSYVHMFWTTVNGHGFLQQGKFVAGHPDGVYWGAHFSLTLLAFLPFFAIWQSPYALLVAKSFLLAASVPMLWFVARQHVESRRVAGLIVLSYAFNPFLWSAWAFDFQEQILLPPLVLAGYYLYVRGRRGAFLVVLTLALFTNEFVVPIAFGFLLGLTASTLRDGSLSRADVRTLLTGFGLVVVAHVVAGFVISQFSTVVGVPVGVLAGPFRPLFDGTRVSLGQLIPVAVMNPDVTLRALASGLQQKVLSLILFSLPLLFVAYADEVTLGSLAPFVGFAWLVSNRPVYVSFRAHYPLYLLPFLYIGAVRAIGRWGHLIPKGADGRTPELPWTTAAKVAVAILLINAGVFVVIGGGNMKPIGSQTDHPDLIQAGLATVPEDATLVTQNDLYPHVATRPNSWFVANRVLFERYEREIGPVEPEYIVYDTTLRSGWVGQLLTSFGPRIGTEYQLYRYEDGFWVFRRGYEGTPTAVTSDAELTWVSTDHEFAVDDFAVGSATRTSGVLLSEDGAAGQRIWYGPYAVFAPGTYTATYRVYATGTGDRPAATVDVAVGDRHRVVASKQVRPSQRIQEVTVTFTLDRPTSKVEFRGAHAAAGGTVAFDGVTVDRTDWDGPESGVVADNATVVAENESVESVSSGTPSETNETPTPDSTLTPSETNETPTPDSTLTPTEANETTETNETSTPTPSMSHIQPARSRIESNPTEPLQ